VANKIKEFTDALAREFPNKILTIVSFGSRQGERDLDISDVDLLIFSKQKVDVKLIFERGLELKEKIFNLKTTRSTHWIQEYLLGSNSYGGLHLIVLGRDEFDENFNPLSFRLKLLSKIISRNILLFEIKKNYRLLFGEDIIDKARINPLKLSDRITCFLFPLLVLLILPLSFCGRRTFKIWCFKAIKYHYQGLGAIAEIAREQGGTANLDIDFNDELFNLAKIYRYKPDDYKGSILALYLRTWLNMALNLFGS